VGFDLSILYGISSALTWGAGDYSGGIASKKNSAFLVTLNAHFLSLIVLIVVAAIFEPFPDNRTMIVGALAGLVGSIGIISFYHGLAHGKMSIVAPIAAVITAIIPIIYSYFTEGPLELINGLGIILALISIYFITQNKGDELVKTRYIFPVLAGIAFGLFFILLSFAGDESVYWTLVAARSSSVLMISIILTFTSSFKSPSKGSYLVIAFAGIFDTLGNILFILATQVGRLDITSVLTSFYPASTIILARIFQKELISKIQIFGIMISLLAIVLISSN
jgi:drug/metabolite transporter (DMT)-like permease